MITVKHPHEKQNKKQEEFVEKAPKEMKRYWELLYSYGNCTYRYHKKAQKFNPTESDYKEWLEGLPNESIRKEMEKLGFEKCKLSLPFTRYVMEKNDEGMEAFVKGLMGEEEYKEYKQVVVKQ